MRSDEDGPPVLIDDYFQFYLEHGVAMCSSCSLIRRAAMQAAGGFPVGRTMGEDLDTWFRLACIGKIVFLPEVLATYHLGTGACTVAVGNPDVWESYETWLQAGRIPLEVRSSAGKLAVRSRLDTVLYALRLGQRATAKQLLGVLPGRSLMSPMGVASYIACHMPLMPRALRWGMVRFSQKHFS